MILILHNIRYHFFSLFIIKQDFKYFNNNKKLTIIDFKLYFCKIFFKKKFKRNNIIQNYFSLINLN